ncbi:hypothetical protein SESBI_49304 [Sesbania bispinosa]|nr:hypothetical protein SESBI_49304 [Sesbania bispinosa]
MKHCEARSMDGRGGRQRRSNGSYSVVFGADFIPNRTCGFLSIMSTIAYNIIECTTEVMKVADMNLDCQEEA